ncbi:MAG: hypothetical protein JM58_07730 [Peptococcaceae bacterium BICA1-8]|nr:MAG: hypothetical protein JM58_07730 [Peptococcaceae bacterium BICA1-8]
MKFTKVQVITLIVIIFCLFSFFGKLDFIEFFLQDIIYQKRSKINTKILIIGIDERSLEELGQWPWPRNYHAKVVETLNEGQAAVIGLDILFSEKARIPNEDRELIETLKKFNNIVLPVYGNFDKYSEKGLVSAKNIVLPFDEIKEFVHQGHINTFPDPDGVVRRSLLFFEYNGEKVHSFSWEIFTRCDFEGITDQKASKVPLDDWNRFYIDFNGEPGDYDVLSYIDVFNEKIPFEYFENKIILIGSFSPGIDDYYFTPLDYQAPMYGIEVHANIIQNLLQNNFKEESNLIIDLLILIFAACLILFFSNRYSPAKALLAICLLLLGYIFLAVIFYQKGIILPLIYPIALTLTIYFALLIYKYLEELLERKRVTDAFSRYVAPQVVHEILATGKNGIELGGLRKEVTILFIDIRGFTHLSENAEPEEIVAILNEFFDLCANVIFKYEGTLDKFIGDGVMAVFNAPLSIESHALKAVQAAWAIKQGAKDLEERIIKKFGKLIAFGIGINTGPAIIGNIGAKFRMDYTAIGDTVNTAARLENTAKPGQILLGSSTYLFVKENVDVTYLGEISVKGKSKSISAYELNNIKVVE